MVPIDPSWQQREVRKSEKQLVEWLPLGSPDESQFCVGVLRDGTWVMETADGLAILNENSSFNFALALLDSEFVEVRNKICGYFRKFKLDPGKVSDFPYVRLAIHGLHSDGYWIRKAIDWLHYMALSPVQRNEVVEALMEVEVNRQLEQKLRHSAKRFRIRLQSSCGGATDR